MAPRLSSSSSSTALTTRRSGSLSSNTKKTTSSSSTSSTSSSLTQLCVLLLLGILAVAVQDLKLLTRTANVSLVRQLQEEEHSAGRMLQQSEQQQQQQQTVQQQGKGRAPWSNLKGSAQQQQQQKGGQPKQQQSKPPGQQAKSQQAGLQPAPSNKQQQQRSLQVESPLQQQQQQQQYEYPQTKQQRQSPLGKQKQRQPVGGMKQGPKQNRNQQQQQARPVPPKQQQQQQQRSLESESNQQYPQKTTTTGAAVHSYSSHTILQSMSLFHTWDMRLLIWDGDSFHTFGVGFDNSTRPEFGTSPRLVRLIPFLVYALRTNFPDRFVKGGGGDDKSKEVFELLFTEADLISSFCSVDNHCGGGGMDNANANNVPPILAFGSMYKNASVLPSVQLMPTPSRWFKCLFENHLGTTGNGKPSACQLGGSKNTAHAVPFEELKPQMAWRGTDWQFLPHLQDHKYPSFNTLVWKTTSDQQEYGNENRASAMKHLQEIRRDMNPRWKAALLSMEVDEELKNNGDPSSTTIPWIDSRFVDGAGMNAEYRNHLMQLGLHVNGGRIEEDEMMGNKYQVDWGGGGGTTWDGTLGKLVMPGLLFHHETPTMDWFHDELEPWKHYVPIATDLSDLKQKFEWAEKHPQNAKAIAMEGTRLAERLLSVEYQQETFQKLFVDYLGQVINAYQPPPSPASDTTSGTTDPGDTPLRSRLHFYRRNGLHVNRLSHCNVKACRTLQQNGDFKSMRNSK